MANISPKTYWVIGIAAIVVIAVLLYWAKMSRVPSPDVGGMRQQNEAAQKEAAAKSAARAAAELAAKAAAMEAAKESNPLLVGNPVVKAGVVRLKLK